MVVVRDKKRGSELRRVFSREMPEMLQRSHSCTTIYGADMDNAL